MRLILVRHGETEENSSGTVQGQLPGVLTGKGKSQAEAAGKLLAGLSVEAAYSSDLSRARESARIITAFMPGLSVIPEPGLREQHLGVHQGGSVFALMKRMRKAGSDITSFDPEGGETSGEFRARVEGVIGRISEAHPEDTVLAVTHHGFIRMFLEIFAAGQSRVQVREMSKNGAVTFAELDGFILRDVYTKHYQGKEF